MPRILTMLCSVLLLAGASAAHAAQDYPPVIKKLVAQQGARILDRFEAPGGLTAYGAQVGGRSLILYVTPDGKHFLVGALFDEQGKNLTTEQIAKYVTGPVLDGAWAKLEQANWFATGAKDPKTIIYEVDDPNCPFCHLFWLANQPYLKEGLQIRHILVGIVTDSSRAKAAAILESPDPGAAFNKNERDYNVKGPENDAGAIAPLKNPSKQTLSKLDANYRLMQELGVRGTPGIFLKDKDGKVQRIDGLPKLSELPKLYGLPAQPITNPLLQRWK